MDVDLCHLSVSRSVCSSGSHGVLSEPLQAKYTFLGDFD